LRATICNARYSRCKEVKKAVAKDEKEFFIKGFDDGMDAAKAWRTANVINSNCTSGGWRRLEMLNHGSHNLSYPFIKRRRRPKKRTKGQCPI
jgi:hypothetical protein